MQQLELVRLAESDDLDVESIDNAVDETTDTEEKPVPLAEQRRAAILDALRAAGASRVLDLGCGQGQLVQALLKDMSFKEIVGVDVSMRALTIASRRLKLERMGSGRPPGSRSDRARSPTPTSGSRGTTRRCSARSSNTSTCRGCPRWSTPCSPRPVPGPCS